MRKLLRRPSPAMILACLALFVASTGTSFAARHYLITSTKQIKPSVIKKLKGAKGRRGYRGHQGAAGATGTQGAQGLKGATGAQGAQGLTGATGATGAQGAQGTGNACNAGENLPSSPPALAEYTSWTTIAECSITLPASHKVLIVGQFTAESYSNVGDAFARALVDGTLVDGDYWASVSAVNPGTSGGSNGGRAVLPVSRVVTLASGHHTITLQGSYWDGGTDRTVTANTSSISAVDLG